MKLLLTRHGEIQGNVDRVVVDDDAPLTTLGIEQAQKLGIYLKDIHIDAIFVSPIKRARITASYITQYHKNALVFVEKNIRESDPGENIGKRYDEVDWEKTPIGGESKEELSLRAKTFFEQLYKQYPHAVILLVSHNAFSKALIRHLRGWPFDDSRPIPQYNAAVNIFDITEDGVEELVFNFQKHLE